MKEYVNFIKFPVIELKDVDTKSSRPLPRHEKLDIVLDYIDIDTLPYRGTYCHHLRENTKRIVARGEDRDYDQIALSGGIFPHPMEKNGNYLSSDKILDVSEHRENSLGTGFVSYSVSLDQLKLSQYESRLGTNKTIFFIVVTGAVPPLADDKHAEMEYSQIGGNPLEDVIAMRELGTTKYGDLGGQKFSFENSPIYIRKDFIEKYPWSLEKILDAYLEKDREKCDISPEFKQILADFPLHKFIPPKSPALLRFQPVFKRAYQHVYEEYLSQDYQDPRVAADSPHLGFHDFKSYAINRPTHSLASTMRMIAFAKTILLFYKAKGRNAHLYREITEELFQKCTIAMLFLLVGRTNALAYYQDMKEHEAYKKRSAAAFEKFILADIEKTLFTKADITILSQGILYSGIPEQQQHPIHLIMDAALKLDLGRCYEPETVTKKAVSIAAEIGEPLLGVLLEYAHQCRIATGDRTINRGNHYNDGFFIKSSTDAEYCLARIHSVRPPDPYADFIPKKRPEAKDTKAQQISSESSAVTLFQQPKRLDKPKGPDNKRCAIL